MPWQPRGLTCDDADSIAVASNQVIIGGTFGFGAFDSKTGAKLPWSRQVDGSPVVVAVAGDRVYVGGNVRSSFASVDRHKTNNLAAYDLRLHRWTSWAPNLAKYTSVAAIVPSGGTVLVAGGFSASLG